MIEKVHIIESHFYDKKKDGTSLTYVSKKDGKNKPYKKVKLVLGGGKQVWGAAFSTKQEEWIKSISPDAETELDITQTPDGKYFNFEFPKVESKFATMAQLSQLVKRIEEVEEFMHEVKSGKKSWVSSYDSIRETLENDIDSDSIPF